MQDGRWYNTYSNPDLVTRYKATHKSRTSNNDFLSLENDEHDSLTHHVSAKIPLPNINQNSRYSTHASTANTNENILYDSNSASYFFNNFRNLPKIQNESDLIEQLKSQIVRRRRKRSIANPTTISPPAPDDDTNDHLESKEGRKRLRGPCEDINWDQFSNITVVRAGKAPGRNSVGIMLYLECNAGFKLNIKGENATARCIRGIWKPDTPKCLSGNVQESHLH